MIAAMLASGALAVTLALSGQAQVCSVPMPPCAYEDSPGPCYWDAGSFGNGVGRSFWVDTSQVVHYLDGKPAPHHKKGI
jgi:hypothetical protein